MIKSPRDNYALSFSAELAYWIGWDGIWGFFLLNALTSGGGGGKKQDLCINLKECLPRLRPSEVKTWFYRIIGKHVHNNSMCAHKFIIVILYVGGCLGTNAKEPWTYIEMVEVARRIDAASNFTGSGGAVMVFCPEGPSQVKLLEQECWKCWNSYYFITIYISNYEFSLPRSHANTEIKLDLKVLNIPGYSQRKDE